MIPRPPEYPLQLRTWLSQGLLQTTLAPSGAQAPFFQLDWPLPRGAEYPGELRTWLSQGLLQTTLGFSGGFSRGGGLPRRRSPHRGFDLEAWKREHLGEEAIARTIEETYARLQGWGEPEQQAEIEALVAPFVETGSPIRPDGPPIFSIDWAAMARADDALRQMIALAQEQEDEDFLLIMQ
jgi:hypothetical protein